MGLFLTVALFEGNTSFLSYMLAWLEKPENESVTLSAFCLLLDLLVINTDVVVTHDFPMSEYEEVSYTMSNKTFQTKDINISNCSIQYSSLFDICISVRLC